MAPLPFDVRRSKSSLLKLVNDHFPHHNQSCSVAVGPKKYGPAGLQHFFYWAGGGKEGVFLINFAFTNSIVKSDRATPFFVSFCSRLYLPPLHLPKAFRVKSYLFKIVLFKRILSSSSCISNQLKYRAMLLRSEHLTL